MARSSTSPANRLKVLSRAKERAAKLKRGEVLGAQPMAKLLEVSWPTLREWCNDIDGFAESGAFTTGGQGVDYEFKPSATIRFLTRHFEKVQAGRIDKARRTRRIVGGSKLAAMPEEFDLEEMGKLLKTIGALRDAQERDSQLVDRGEVVTVLRGLFPAMLQAGLTAAQTADPTGSWSQTQRDAADKTVRIMLTAQQKTIERELGKISGGTA